MFCKQNQIKSKFLLLFLPFLAISIAGTLVAESTIGLTTSTSRKSSTEASKSTSR